MFYTYICFIQNRWIIKWLLDFSSALLSKKEKNKVAYLMVMLSSFSLKNYPYQILKYQIPKKNPNRLFFVNEMVLCGNRSRVSFQLSDILKDYCKSVCYFIVSIRQFP